MTLNAFNICNFNGLTCSYTGTLSGKDFNLFVLETGGSRLLLGKI